MQQTDCETAWYEASFTQFYQDHASPLLDYLRAHTRTLEDAEDILVDTFMAARQNREIAREVPRGQMAWLRQVARNKLADYYRRQGQTQVVPLEQARDLMHREEPNDPESALLQIESLTDLQAAIRCLPEAQQELLRLRFSEELHCPQIAARLGKRAGAIRTMLARTLKTLREIYRSQEAHL
jgi:RNA polymerase sigma-70 factor (ECF subfamily)